MLVEVYDAKKRNEIIQNYLQNRKDHKFKNLQERNDLENVEDNRVEVFKPILDSNRRLQNEIIEEKNKIVETLNSFKEGIQDRTSKMITQDQDKSIMPEPKIDKSITVSNLIVSYLQDGSDKSNAGYSLRYDPSNKKYTIGNKDVIFDNNTIRVNGVSYEATNGLMELLTKKSPNLIVIEEKDTRSYQTILFASNALYQGFDNTSKRYNADSSDKWRFIKANYFVNKPQPTSQSTINTSPKSNSSSDNPTSSGSSIDFLPSNLNSLIESLRLSVGSYHAGNTSEYNKIHSIFDELLRQKKIKKKDLGVIYMNIGL